ncbi:hypothetical protein [Pseudarthrobacter sp. NBSH8]|uniref:hypothetical protein n=1 Tax=Pseudarthrobacter sp. NBSH8 TaxID=2596911 RepID=UPI0021027041|nr:hypothetical protein [Pseudarthrobacter sp. NBSH8]
MRSTSAIGLAAASILALAACTGGDGGQSPSPTGTATTSAAAADKVYSEDELRELIAGMRDAEGNELKLYSQDQVAQGSNIANLLLSTATVDPQDCKSIAAAGLLDKVDNGDVAVALSESAQPRTLSAQSGSEGPDAVELLQEVSAKMNQCANFSVEALGQRYEVSSEELQAETDGAETFATLSTRGQGTNENLMQVSAAEGRLLVVATKGGSDLGDDDQKELEDLVNEVLAKADGGSATSSPTGTSTGSSTGTASPTSSASPTAAESEEDMSPSPTTTSTSTP